MRDELVSLDPDKEVKITNKCEFERRPYSIMMEQDCFLTSASSLILPLLFLWSGVTDQSYGSPQEFPSIYQNDPQDLCFLHIVLYVTVLWLTSSTPVSCWVYLPRPWCWTNIIYRLRSLGRQRFLLWGRISRRSQCMRLAVGMETTQNTTRLISPSPASSLRLPNSYEGRLLNGFPLSFFFFVLLFYQRLQ